MQCLGVAQRPPVTFQSAQPPQGNKGESSAEAKAGPQVQASSSADTPAQDPEGYAEPGLAEHKARDGVSAAASLGAQAQISVRW